MRPHCPAPVGGSVLGLIVQHETLPGAFDGQLDHIVARHAEAVGDGLD